MLEGSPNLQHRRGLHEFWHRGQVVTFGVVVLEPYRQRIGDFLIVALIGIAEELREASCTQPRLTSQLRAGKIGGVQDFGNGDAYFFKTDLILFVHFIYPFWVLSVLCLLRAAVARLLFISADLPAEIYC